VFGYSMLFVVLVVFVEVVKEFYKLSIWASKNKG